MPQDDHASHDGHASDAVNGKTKTGRTPLKLHPMTRPNAASAGTPLRRRRKRLGGKRTVRSCTSCRASHVRCVADRYGVPCERCAKKSWLDCTLMQDPNEKPAVKSTSPDEDDTLDRESVQNDVLKEIASDAMMLVVERAESPSMTDESMGQLAVESPSHDS